MELVPKIPSNRVIEGLQWAAAAVIVGLALSCAAHGVFVFVAAGLTLFFVRRTLRASDLRLEGALDRFECVAIVVARTIAVTALAAFAFGGPVARVLAGVAFAASVALMGVALFRDRMRMRFLARVYANEDPDFRIARDDEVRGFELLPPVLSGTITDAVIAHVSTLPGYRTSDGPRPLARVTRSLAKMNARIAKRTRTAMMTTIAVAACSTLVVTGPLVLLPEPSAVAHTPLPAPACTDAIPYFEERLQSIPGVGRATLVTHDRDPAIAVHAGAIVYVPAAGATASDALDERVLSTAAAIPCDGKLALSVVRPTYRAFRVAVNVTVEEGADEASVLRDVDEQVRELFQPDARAVFNEHFGFGATEKTFGYRIRHALRHVTGVKSAKLTIDGSDVDVALGPRDFPTLAALTISK